MGGAAMASREGRLRAGMELHAHYTLIAEGVRGSLSRELDERFQLREGIDPAKVRHRHERTGEIDPANISLVW